MKILGIIPARYQSSRFPGKPLAVIDGKPMIQRVYEQAQKASSITELMIATDDERIFNAVKTFGGNVLMTSSRHESGTERCAEIVEQLRKDNKHFDIIINIQGDEPFIGPAQIDLVSQCFTDGSIQISTLAKKIIQTNELFNPNTVKVVADKNNMAIYFSRSAIPFCRTKEQNDWLSAHDYYKHIGIYAYRYTTLEAIVKLKPSMLEKAESLEQLRWIENGYSIYVGITDHENIAIDTPDDLLKIGKKSSE